MRKYIEGCMIENPSSALEPEKPKAPFVLPPDEEAEKQIVIQDMRTDELLDACFIGIDLVTYDGKPFSRTMLVQSINSAVDAAEQMFDISIRTRVVEDEIHDYEGESMWNFQYTPLYHRPIQEISKMEYFIGNRKILSVPEDWIQVDKRMGEITIFPTSGSMQLISPDIGTVLPFFVYRNYMPMGIKVSYVAGMKKEQIPKNLLDWIYKKAAISIFEVWGDQIIGAGIASSSISIDGLSQSIGTTQSAMYGGASARILEYRKDLDELTTIIRKHFARFDAVVL